MYFCNIRSCAGGLHSIPPPYDRDLLTLKVVPESRVTWATSVPILVFLGPMYATDRQTDVRQTDIIQHHRLMPPPIGAGHNNAGRE